MTGLHHRKQLLHQMKVSDRVVFVRGKPGNFPLTGSGGMERGRGGKGKGGGDHLPYFPPLVSASNTTLVSDRDRNVDNVRILFGCVLINF